MDVALVEVRTAQSNLRRRCGGAAFVPLGVSLPHVYSDDEVRDLEPELRRRYGPYFLVVRWEGDNQEDVGYELYRFSDQQAYEGFLASIQNYPDADPDLSRRSTAYARGYRRATEEHEAWQKFAWVAFRSA